MTLNDLEWPLTYHIFIRNTVHSSICYFFMAKKFVNKSGFVKKSAEKQQIEKRKDLITSVFWKCHLWDKKSSTRFFPEVKIKIKHWKPCKESNLSNLQKKIRISLNGSKRIIEFSKVCNENVSAAVKRLSEYDPSLIMSLSKFF